MSRKRAQRREDRRGLAQQLGVKAAEVPGQLLAHERTTTPRVSGTALSVDTLPTRWFQRSAAAELVLCLFVVDSQGVRLCRAQGWSQTAKRQLTLPLEGSASAKRVLEDTVRYRRPGHFVLAAGLAVLDDGAHSGGLLQGLPDWLLEPEALTLSGEVLAMGAPAIGRCTTPQPVACPRLEAKGYRTAALGLLSLPAAGRVVSSCMLPLVSQDDALRASVAVDVRL
ncbi:MAG: hypothetical protein ACO3JL_11940 [Myxococcota bacterium]